MVNNENGVPLTSAMFGNLNGLAMDTNGIIYADSLTRNLVMIYGPSPVSSVPYNEVIIGGSNVGGPLGVWVTTSGQVYMLSDCCTYGSIHRFIVRLLPVFLELQL